MSKLNNALRSVPAIDKQELLFYIAEHFPETTLRIATDSGHSYGGILLTIGKVKKDDAFLVLQIIDERHQLTDRFIHLSLHKVASIEMIDPADLVNILSLGKITTGEQYEISGKLEVRRAFQSFSETIFNTCAVPVEVPAMELPEDGQQLNRVLKLTQKIQDVIIDLLKEEDARTSWKARYTKIVFINNNTLDVKGMNDSIEIHFAFNNITAPEISAEALNGMLMGIL
ncbi:hypothetical protein FAM09_18970 [Niastella caeni]|uniref:Uncharacterized protein n=1 Tax=Niastella caeni TaxID=2569763 RepID=A0A4S8HNS8_9BACT|nr:hypothetical protein [Niastella caeni]THU37038.1 hypothetical protein FAM09_18970 [Niastella caeni]